jgi:cell division protein FtsB
MLFRKLDRKIRKLVKLGWLVALLISAWALLSPWGAIRYYRISKDLKQIKAANLELRDNNRQLEEEINRLTNDPASIEKVARRDYGLLRTNEFVYEFSDKKSGK